MPNTLTATRPCTGPCPYDCLHLVGVDECVYDDRGIVKRGCGREIVYDGPARLLRVNAFSCVTRELDGGSIRMFWQRARTVVRLTVYTAGSWRAEVETSRRRAVIETGETVSEYAALRALAAQVGR